MTQAPRIVICDDDAARADDWATRVRRVSVGTVVEAMPPVGFAAAVRDLKVRMRRAKSDEWFGGSDKASAFDAADVLVLDSDLTPDRDSHRGEDPQNLIETHLVSELGAEVAHLARAYTTAGAIVVVNQGVKSRTFDLTMSKMATGVADAYVTDDELDDPGLWDPARGQAYRPWSWPALSRLPLTIADALQRLDLTSCVMAELGLTDARIASALLARQIELVGRDAAEDVLTMTVDDVAQSGFGLGVRPKEKTSPEQLLRVGVCGVRHWLERVVLPAQNILIDLPHLLQHNPWVVPNRDNLAAWNGLKGRWFGEASPVLEEAYNLSASQVLGRNVWNVHDLPTRLAGQRVKPSDPVFCEDDSRFAPLSGVVDFLPDIEGTHTRRFIARVEGVEYAPRSRLVT